MSAPIEEGFVTLTRREVETVQALILHAQKYLPWTPDIADVWRTVFKINNKEAPHG